MPWSFVSAFIEPDSTSVSKAVTAGNLLVVGFVDQTPSDILAISDGVNTWTRIGTQLNDTVSVVDYSMTWWWAKAATTATITATITGQGGGHHGLWLSEHSHSAGAIGAGALVAATQDGTHNGGGAGHGGSTATDGDTSGAATPGVNGCLILGWLFETDAGSGSDTPMFNAGTSFTKRTTASNDSVNFEFVWAVEDREQATSASAAATWTGLVDNSYAAMVGFFQPPAAGSASLTPTVVAQTLAGTTPARVVGTIKTPVTP
jgi:hypothetical protein